MAHPLAGGRISVDGEAGVPVVGPLLRGSAPGRMAEDAHGIERGRIRGLPDVGIPGLVGNFVGRAAVGHDEAAFRLPLDPGGRIALRIGGNAHPVDCQIEVFWRFFFFSSRIDTVRCFWPALL